MSEKNNSEISNAVQVLIDTGEGWLLEHRQNKDGIFWPNRYGLWGGAFEIEDEHSSLKAALRELFEEGELGTPDLEFVKMAVVDYREKVYIKSNSSQTKVHYYYARLKNTRAIHAYEGDKVEVFPYQTQFENNSNFTPYVADAVHLAARIKK